MIAKKNSRFDLERKRIVFFQVGLLSTGSLVLAAFTYSSPEVIKKEKEVITPKHISYELVPEEQEPIVTPQRDEVFQQNEEQNTASIDLQSPPDENINSTENSTELARPDANVDVRGFMYDPNFDPNKIALPEAPVIPFPDREAEYVGGFNEMQRFITDRTDYPQECIEMDIQGKVYISFIIETDGSVSNVTVARGVHKALDREARRIVRSFPKWIPGEVQAEKVRTRVQVPITFILD